MAETIAITICFSPAPRTVCELTLQLAAGSTLSQAVALAVQQPGWPQGWDEQQCHTLSPSVWGRKMVCNGLVCAVAVWVASRAPRQPTMMAWFVCMGFFQRLPLSQ